MVDHRVGDRRGAHICRYRIIAMEIRFGAVIRPANAHHRSAEDPKLHPTMEAAGKAACDRGFNYRGMVRMDDRPMRTSTDALNLRVVVRRAAWGSAPFRWQVINGDWLRPIHDSPDLFRSMEAAHKAGEVWLEYFLLADRSASSNRSRPRSNPADPIPEGLPQEWLILWRQRRAQTSLDHHDVIDLDPPLPGRR
jgi:hypothetical protein